MTTQERTDGRPARTRTMRAAVRDRYGMPAQVLRMAQVAVPDIGSDDVLVSVRGAGVDRGSWHIVTGLPYPLRLAGYGLRAPKEPVVGADLSGVVAAVG